MKFFYRMSLFSAFHSWSEDEKLVVFPVTEPQEGIWLFSDRIPPFRGTPFNSLLSFSGPGRGMRPRCWWGKGELLAKQTPGSSETGIRSPQRNRSLRKKTYSEEGFHSGFLKLRETIYFSMTLALCAKHLWRRREVVIRLKKWLSERCQVKGSVGMLQLLAWLRERFFLLGAVSVSYDDVDFLV